MSLPYFRMYPTDYEAKTAHLSMIEDGAYSRLLRLCWSQPDCSLPDDDEWIMRRMRARTDEEREAVKTVLTEYFSREKQRVFNKRLSEEHAHANERHRTASENGKKGGRPANAMKEKEKDQSYGLAEEKRAGKLKKANQNHNQNHNIPPLPPEGFDEFWSVYPRKVAKPAAVKAYAKAVASHGVEVVIEGAKRYAAAVMGKDAQYIAHAATWLGAERWADDLPPPKKPEPKYGDMRRINGYPEKYDPAFGWFRDMATEDRERQEAAQNGR
jgi:uncharacterized protein YdaU (DUF1376 family)